MIKPKWLFSTVLLGKVLHFNLRSVNQQTVIGKVLNAKTSSNFLYTERDTNRFIQRKREARLARKNLARGQKP